MSGYRIFEAVMWQVAGLPIPFAAMIRVESLVTE